MRLPHHPIPATAIAAAIAIATPAIAIDYSWVAGGGSNNFYNIANWSPAAGAGYPDATNDAAIFGLAA